jgi:hypothetical protein
MVVSLQKAGVAVTPLKVTRLFPCVEPKPPPTMVIVEPIEPELGVMNPTKGPLNQKNLFITA